MEVTTTDAAKATQGPGEGYWVKTRKRVLTRRAVLWLGQTCNLRCYFCYFLHRIRDAHHPEHPFMSLEKAKEICKILREFYGNTAIDLQGGEPTIHPDILELTRYCHDIGLYPTLITNGLRLARPGELEKYQEARVRDFLVSLHGSGEIHDEVVGVPDAYEDIITAIERMRELGIPFRFNCTMSKPVIPVLTEVAAKAIEYGAGAVNYIAFNPYEDQEADIRTHENVARYSDIKPHLTEAIDTLEEAGIEANVRYLPLCIAEERHRKNFYGFQQLSYDIHEWDYESWMWTGGQPQRMKDGPLTPPYRMGWRARWLFYRATRARDWAADHPFRARVAFAGQHVIARLQQAARGKNVMYWEEAKIRARSDGGHQHYDACHRCALQGICDGFHGDYAELFGSDEATPLTDIPPVTDPRHFIASQEKIVEPEDRGWAL